MIKSRLKLFFVIVAVLLSLLSANSFAAKCKVDGVWYSYDSPQCSPDRTNSTKTNDNANTSSPRVMKKGEASWAEARPKALNQCEKKHESYSLQAACMRNEEKGYAQFQSSFGMPTKAEVVAKMNCLQKHDNYSLRAACMRNESKGYEEWEAGYGLPRNVELNAKEGCGRKHQSYSLRAACMRNEKRGYEQLHGKQ